MRRRTLIFVATLLLAGCAINPLKKRFPSEVTIDVVQKVRCEVRDALFMAFVRYLESFGTSDTIALAKRLESLFRTDSMRFETALAALEGENIGQNAFVDKDGMSAKQHSNFLVKLLSSSIAYTFTFDIKEQNTAGLGLDFAPSRSRGTSALDVGFDGNLTRRGVRTFTVADNFGEYQETSCYEDYTPGKYVTGSSQNKQFRRTKARQNFAYPIKGSTGVVNTIDNYIELVQLRRKSQSGVSDFTDTLTFTTVTGGGADPVVIFSPAVGGLNLVKASAGLSFEVTNEHKLALAISAPPAKKKPTKDFEVSIGKGAKLVFEVPAERLVKRSQTQSRKRGRRKAQTSRSSSRATSIKILRNSGVSDADLAAARTSALREVNRERARQDFRRAIQDAAE